MLNSYASGWLGTFTMVSLVPSMVCPTNKKCPKNGLQHIRLSGNSLKTPTANKEALQSIAIQLLPWLFENPTSLLDKQMKSQLELVSVWTANV